MSPASAWRMMEDTSRGVSPPPRRVNCSQSERSGSARPGEARGARGAGARMRERARSLRESSRTRALSAGRSLSVGSESERAKGVGWGVR